LVTAIVSTGASFIVVIRHAIALKELEEANVLIVPL
jgi:hypothetical protein